VICDFIQVPESIESKNKPNPTVVLTSGCGFGVSTSKTAKIAAETIKFEMDRFVNKLIQKNSETTPAKIIQAQLEAINFAHRILVANRILVSNKEKFGSTELAVANFIDGTLIVTSIGKIKTFVVDKEKKGTFCFELGDPKVQTSGAIGNVPPYKQALNEISCAVLKLKKDSKVVICSKGAYDNLDPLIETSETKASRQIRSKHMAEKLNKLHGLFKEDQGFGAAIETYNQAMAFKKNKEDLQNLGTFSIDKEVSTAEQVIKLKSSRFEANTKWKSLFSDDGNLDGKPGFVTFAIMSHG
jgi:hypothetical protein